MKKFLIIILALTAVLFASCNKGNANTESMPENTLKADNNAVDFYFYYPDTWKLDRNDGMISIRYNTAASSTQETYASISFMAATLKDTTQVVNQYWDAYKEDIAKTYDNYQLIEESETKLDNVVASKKVYKGGLNGTDYKFAQVICIRNGVVYIATLTASVADYDNKDNSIVANFDKTVSYFHFK